MFIIMFPNVSMMYPIVLILIMGLYSHQHGICFKVFIADSGEEFRQLVINCIYYVNSIIVSFVLWTGTLHNYRIEHTISNTHPKYLPIGL